MPNRGNDDQDVRWFIVDGSDDGMAYERYVRRYRLNPLKTDWCRTAEEAFQLAREAVRNGLTAAIVPTEHPPSTAIRDRLRAVKTASDGR